jgi:hypothetical protein
MRDERTYKRAVEMQLLPLVRAMPSPIEQSHFIHIISERIGAPEDAVRLALKQLPDDPDYGDIGTDEPESTAPIGGDLPQFEKSVGMLLMYYKDSDPMRERVDSLIGRDRARAIELIAESERERLLFQFEAMDEDTAKSAEALLTSIERSVLEEEMKRLRVELYAGSPSDISLVSKRLVELKRRQEELRK